VSRADLLAVQMDEVYARLRGRLEGLGEEEYFWEPVPGCWTVHRDESGAWVTDYADRAAEGQAQGPLPAKRSGTIRRT
jgi:hypothetical protein